MKNEQFLFIDVETTGLRANKDRITEITLSIVKDGKVKTQWHSAINPNIKKNRHPSFKDIATELHKLLKKKIIVAHNARFIYGFLQQEMQRCGITLSEKTLCSISLSRLLFPESKDHTLEAINDRLFQKSEENKRLPLLMNFFNQLDAILTPVDLQMALTRLTQSSEYYLSLEHKDKVPKTAGIYRCYDENNMLIYIGKSESLKQSLSSHFQIDKNTHKEIQISKRIKKIDWLKTSGPLGTALYASHYIKKHKPLFNRIIEKNKNLFTLQLQNNGDYLALKLMKLSDILACELPTTFGIFKSKKDATNLLNFFINESDLCYQINDFSKMKSACFRFHINKCKGGCKKIESAEEYNVRVKKIISTFTQNRWPFKKNIAIKETCTITKNISHHVVNHWIYLGTVKSTDDITTYTLPETKVDVANYILINEFLINPENASRIIEL